MANICFKFDLLTGINLISIPITDTTVTKASELAAKSSNITKIMKWNPTTQAYISFIPGTPINNFSIIPNEGYSITVNAPITITLNGMQTPDVVPYSLGSLYSLIGTPINDPTVTKASELAAKSTSITKLLKWNNVTQTYITFIPGTPINNFNIIPGEGYFVYTNNLVQFTLIGTPTPTNCPPNIVATDIILYSGDNSPTLDIQVTWKNTGIVVDTFIPGIKVDNSYDILMTYPITLNPNDQTVQHFIINNLSSGTYTFCPI